MRTEDRRKRSVAVATSLLALAVGLPTAIAASEGPTVVATIELGSSEEATAFALAVNPHTGKTYVTPGFEPQPSGCESHIVSVIDNATNTVLPPIRTGLSPFGLAVNAKTNKVYVANIGGGICSDETSNTVSVIDGSTDTVAKTIAVQGIGPAWVAVNERTNKVYVTINGGCCASENAVAVIDGSNDTVLRYVEVDPDPFIAAVDPRANRIYVTHAGADEITVIDGVTDTVRGSFSIGSEARAIAFDPGGKVLYVAARNTNQLAVVDAATNAVVQRIPVGGRPHGVAVGNGRIYVANRGACGTSPGTVSVIQRRTWDVLATVEVGTCPRFLDLDAETGLVYVPNASTGRSVSVIRDE